MHAYLLVGSGGDAINCEIDKLVKRISAKVIEFEIKKIEDVRKLIGFTKLKIDTATIVLVNNLQDLSHEAANALLKSIEEPQVNLFYILVTNNIHKVIPTITSRCQVIYITSQPANVSQEALDFDAMTIGEKLTFISQIKDRESALQFAETLINYYQHDLQDKVDIRAATNVKSADKLYLALLDNGNVKLQLLNFITHLV
ncbi:hypothetical protein IPM62_02880 [Candidatus Woesebacteria bacterium]|nr:MAG: hypothetical protein IPM62_02880 [Candidatus Woesebacteria bacterium]